MLSWYTQNALRNLENLGATATRNYSQAVRALIEEVNSISFDEPEDCCDFYDFQLLDKYCAKQSPVC